MVLSLFYSGAFLECQKGCLMSRQVPRWYTELASDLSLSISTETIPLSEVRGWKQTAEQVSRDDGRFFQVVGARIKAGTREVSEWDQPMLREKEPGFVGVIARQNPQAEVEFLVRLRVEPGCEFPLVAPTLQTSLSNLQRAHKGKLPPRVKLFGLARDIEDFTKNPKAMKVRMDPGRFLDKTNYYFCRTISSGRKVRLEKDERWCTREEIADAADAGVCNEHLLLATYFFKA